LPPQFRTKVPFAASIDFTVPFISAAKATVAMNETTNNDTINSEKNLRINTSVMFKIPPFLNRPFTNLDERTRKIYQTILILTRKK
jgi:hypothetical protein